MSSILGVALALISFSVAHAATTATDAPLVIFLGDSLTAGYGLPGDHAFPTLVAEALRARGKPIRAVNAGVSGDTTTGALERLDWLLKQRPDVLVVELGANDAFRGQPVERIEANIREIVRRGKAAGARVLLLGMRIPTNYGPEYADAFAALYVRVAKDQHVELMPFLLDGVGGHADLNQGDGIHPNDAGEKIVADHVVAYVERVLGAAR
ncbi:MAG TPA: arylesterase [Candidatus Polarisedimenticolaceae bacterium]|nr:arylesterase [Candidatus Polarisedimenticolaceae bacterium]